MTLKVTLVSLGYWSPNNQQQRWEECSGLGASFQGPGEGPCGVTQQDPTEPRVGRGRSAQKGGLVQIPD